MRVCFLIPTYNHSERLGRVLERLAHHQLPCLLIDDGSTADHVARIDQLCIEHSWVTLIRYPTNAGKGAAIKLGAAEARLAGFTHFFQIDSDGQHDLKQVRPFLDCAYENPQATILGFPKYDDTVPKSRYWSRYLTHFWVWINTLSFSIKDAMCGFRIYRVEPVLKLSQIGALGNRMEFDIQVAVRLAWLGEDLVNKEVGTIYPETGTSHFRMIKDNARISFAHTKLFFGALLRLPSLLRRHLIHRNNDSDEGLGSQTRGQANSLISGPSGAAGKKGDRVSREWFNIGEVGTSAGIRFLAAVHRWGGKYLVAIALVPVIAYYVATNATARGASLQYLTHLKAHSPSVSIEPTTGFVFRHFLAFAHSILDRISAWTGALNVEDVEFAQRQHLEYHLQRGQGLLLVGAHLGCLDVARALSKYKDDITLNVLIHTKNAQRANNFLKPLTGIANFELIEVTEVNPATMLRLSQKVERGEIVVMVADRIPLSGDQNTVEVDFLGHSARFPQGPWILAHLLKCPVMTLFAIKEAGRYDLYCEPFSDRVQLSRNNRPEEITELASRFAKTLEEYCLKGPLQWFNFYPFWQPAKQSVDS